MPEAGASSYLKRLLVDRPIPTHLPHHGRRSAAIVLLRLVAALATMAIVGAAAAVLWLAPWPVDAVSAIAAAAAWMSWVESQEQNGP